MVAAVWSMPSDCSFSCALVTRLQDEVVLAEVAQADGSSAQIVYLNNAPVEPAALERLCTKVGSVDQVAGVVGGRARSQQRSSGCAPR